MLSEKAEARRRRATALKKARAARAPRREGVGISKQQNSTQSAIQASPSRAQSNTSPRSKPPVNQHALPLPPLRRDMAIMPRHPLHTLVTIRSIAHRDPRPPPLRTSRAQNLFQASRLDLHLPRRGRGGMGRASEVREEGGRLVRGGEGREVVWVGEVSRVGGGGGTGWWRVLREGVGVVCVHWVFLRLCELSAWTAAGAGRGKGGTRDGPGGSDRIARRAERGSPRTLGALEENRWEASRVGGPRCGSPSCRGWRSRSGQRGGRGTGRGAVGAGRRWTERRLGELGARQEGQCGRCCWGRRED